MREDDDGKVSCLPVLVFVLLVDAAFVAAFVKLVNWIGGII